MDGEVRSCGCAAKDYGGLGRRASFLDIVRDSTDNFLLLEAGDFFGTKLNYGKEKADITIKSLAFMRYHAVTIGEDDLSFGLDFLLERVDAAALPVLVANMYDAAADTLVFPPSRVVTLDRGLRVGIIGVMSKNLKMPPQVEEGRLRFSSPGKAIQTEVEKLAPDVDFLVVIGHMPRREVSRLATDHPDVDLFITGHEGRPMRNLRRSGEAYVLQVPGQGREMGLAYATLGEDGRIAALVTDISPLSKAYSDHEAVAKLFRSYDMSVAAKEKSSIPAAVFEARAGLKKPFKGSQSCEECHKELYDHWETTSHSFAFERLVSQSRHFDRDCTPCHSTGFYKIGGFENPEVTPELVDVGCESCHGNGHDHVADPKQPMEISDASSGCRACHTVDQTPDFLFATFWERIKHPQTKGLTEGGLK